MGEEVPSDAAPSTELNEVAGSNTPAPAAREQGERHEPATPAAASGAELPADNASPDDDSTPRSQAPSTVDSQGDEHHDASSDGYFTPVTSLNVPPPHLTTSSATASFIEPSSSSSSSHDASISHLDLTSIAQASRSSLHDERPVPHHTLSSTSTTSTATVRASDYMSPSSRPSAKPSRIPHFPNQAYSALQAQQHPPTYPPHILRTRSSNPSPYQSYVAGAKYQKDLATSTPSGSRTAGNSPSGSPGLFTPATSPSRPKSVHDDTSGTYSSPFLHYTQRQVPKETHVADIDVDPISGRKIINQYEIIDELGRGVHGKVKLGRILPEGGHVAIKIVERYSKKKRLGKNTSHEDKIKKEIAILKKVRHPNIVSLLEVIDDPQRKKVYIVLEFVDLGEIEWRIRGENAINLIEYRRHLRELHGIDNDTDEVATEESLILDEARERREEEERQQLRRRHRGRLNSPPADGWSFESQGGIPDEDDANFESLLRVSTGTSGSYRSLSNADHAVQADIQPADLIPPPLEDGTTSAFATITGLSDEMKQRPEPFSHIEFDTVTATGLEGTMYGAYEPEIVRGRTPSVTDSVDSGVLEDPHKTHVPDNFLFVPLMTIAQARNAFRDTVLGLEYLHFQGVIHRDVKPANLLQTSDHRVKISDFGVSYMGRERSATDPDQSESEVPDIDEAVELAKTVGTPAFYAPELCQTDGDDETTPPVTQQIDVWALGVTLYCLIFGRVPFHDHNPFVLMARIAQETVHIPKRRLKAVEKQSASRPSSRGRMFQPKYNTKRDANDLEYEDVDEDLRDLLKRLFVKDPRHRISLTEVKHHPWVINGIMNPSAWLEETDPTRQTGTKIQVSREDVQDAVVPLNIIEKTISNLRKGIGNLTGTLGLGRSSSTRARAKSTATNPDGSNLSSAASSSSTISQDGRRASTRVDESIFSALRASKEPEHPLAQSETASPEYQLLHDQYFSGVKLPSEYSDAESELLREKILKYRPQPERAASTNSGATSTKTIRQRDVSKSLGLPGMGMGHLTFPALPSTPRTLDSPGGSSLGGILGAAGSKISRMVRSRDRRSSRDQSPRSRERSVDRKSFDRVHDSSDDFHAEPSLGFSNAVASGMLRQPELPHSASSSAAASPISSRAASITSPEVRHIADRAVSRQSSISSASSARRRPATASKEPVETVSQYQPPADPAETFDRAREESFRRRIVEEHQIHDRPASAMQSRPLNVLACPPSPDDEIFYRQQMEEATGRPRSAPFEPHATSQNSFSQLPPGRFVTPSSSEDHFTSGLSQSTSNPSIPSVISADSSVVPEGDEGLVLDLGNANKDLLATDPPSDSSTVYQAKAGGRRSKSTHHEDDDGYVGDHTVESGEDDSDSDDNFLEMTRPKGRAKKQAVSRSDSTATAELGSKHRTRRATESFKTGRSGSNSTMQKISLVRSHSSGEEEALKTASC